VPCKRLVSNDPRVPTRRSVIVRANYNMAAYHATRPPGALSPIEPQEPIARQPHSRGMLDPRVRGRDRTLTEPGLAGEVPWPPRPVAAAGRTRSAAHGTGAAAAAWCSGPRPPQAPGRSPRRQPPDPAAARRDGDPARARATMSRSPAPATRIADGTRRVLAPPVAPGQLHLPPPGPWLSPAGDDPRHLA